MVITVSPFGIRQPRISVSSITRRELAWIGVTRRTRSSKAERHLSGTLTGDGARNLRAAGEDSLQINPRCLYLLCAGAPLTEETGGPERPGMHDMLPTVLGPYWTKPVAVVGECGAEIGR